VYKGVKELLYTAGGGPAKWKEYGEAVELRCLAASYAVVFAKSHPFLDGKKRTSLFASVAFLNLNGFDFDVDPPEMYELFYDLAQGSLSEEGLANWFRNVIYRIED